MKTFFSKSVFAVLFFVGLLGRANPLQAQSCYPYFIETISASGGCVLGGYQGYESEPGGGIALYRKSVWTSTYTGPGASGQDKTIELVPFGTSRQYASCINFSTFYSYRIFEDWGAEVTALYTHGHDDYEDTQTISSHTIKSYDYYGSSHSGTDVLAYTHESKTELSKKYTHADVIKALRKSINANRGTNYAPGWPSSWANYNFPCYEASGNDSKFRFAAYLPRDSKMTIKWRQIVTPIIYPWEPGYSAGVVPYPSASGTSVIRGKGELLRATSKGHVLEVPEENAESHIEIVSVKFEEKPDPSSDKPGDTDVDGSGTGPDRGLASGDCADCGSDGDGSMPRAVSMEMNLGSADDGDGAGSIRFSVANPGYLTTSADIFRVAADPAVVSELVPSDEDLTVKRQVKAPLAIYNIESANENETRVKVYRPTQMSSSPGPDGVHTVNSGQTPFTELSLVRPGGDTNRLTVTQTSDCVTKIWDYTFNTSTKTWLLTRPGGIGEIDSSSSVPMTGGMEMRNRIGVSGSTQKMTKLQLQPFGSTWLPVRREVGSGGNVRVGTFEYNSAYSAVGSFVPMSKKVSADGSWEMFSHTTVSLPGGGSVAVPSKVVSGSSNEVPSLSLPNVPQSEMNYAELSSGGGLSDDDAVLPFIPRKTIQKLNGHEIGTSYTLFNSDRRIDIVASSSSANYWDASNKRTTKVFYNSGPIIGYPKSIQHPDGLATYHTYAFDAGGWKTNKTVYHGVASSWSGDVPTITDGTKTEEVYGQYGQLIAKLDYRIQTVSSTTTTYLVDEVVYSNFDDFYRPQTITRKGHPAVTRTYGFCGLSTETDENGTVTTFLYDGARRQIGYTRHGITVSNALNSAGQVIGTWRLGTDASWTRLNGAAYNDAGEMTRQTNALGGVTVFTQAANALGGVTYTTTYPDGGTKVDEYDTGGTLVRTYGTAVNGMKYEDGTETVSGLGTNLRFTKQTRLTSNGSDTSEWTKTHYDHLGQPVRTTYADGSYEQTFYNSDGQVEKTVDPDGVTTLYVYNDLGELEYSGVDVNQNSVLEDGGLDRVTRTLRSVATAHGTNVHRVITSTYKTDNSSTATDVSTVDTTFNGLHQWVTTLAGTAESLTAYSGSQKTVTQISPIGTSAVSVYDYGRLTSTTRKDTNSVTIGSTAYDYDAKGRTWKVTDARNGTTTYAYNAADQPVSVTTPAPGNGQSAQTTTTDYDTSLRAWRVTQPDGTSVTNEFYVTGQLKKTYGSRTYPVEYTYDYAGRMTTMKTWQGFTANTGAATTTWNYDASRGWLTSKRYDDNKGPDYTYTVGSRLKTRQWARTGTGGNRIMTTYNYGFDDTPSGNSYGDLTEITYSYDTNSTNNVVYNYDRLGRRKTVTDIGSRTLAYNDLGQEVSDIYSVTVAGFGSTITRGYDSFGRPLGLTNVSLGTTFTNAYDEASRLKVIGYAGYSATYGYLANSPLVETVTLKNGSNVRLTTTKRYDKLNRLGGIESLPSGEAKVSADYAYNDANQRTRKFEADGSFWIYQYDSLGQVTSGKKYWSDGAPVTGQQFEYAFDDIGNRTSSKSGGDAGGLNLRTAYYTNNALNQYIGRTNPGVADIIGAASPSSTVTVNGKSTVRKGEYFWNEMSLTNLAGPTNFAVTVAATSASTNTGKLLWPAASEIPTYDDDGNLTSDSLWTYTWNAENQLVRMESSTNLANADWRRVDFYYDSNGRRLAKWTHTFNGSTWSLDNSNKVFFYYDGWNCIGQYHASGTSQVYLWGPDLSGSMQGVGGVGGLLMVHGVTAGTASFAAYDGNGNVTALVDASTGTVAARYDYGPFGELVRSSGSLAALNPFRFSTKYQDDESGYLYYGYRYYDSRAGRWISRDPIRERGGLNIHGFIDNEPVNALDILGAQKVIPWPDYFRDWKKLHPELDPEQMKWCENTLARGCIGVTAIHLGEMPKLTDCYRTKAQAEARKAKCECGEPKIFSVHFFNWIGKDGKTADVSFDNFSGKADFSNWDYKAGPGGGAGFDYGFLNPDGTLTHANSNYNPDLDGDGKGDYFPNLPIVTGSNILISTLDEWQEGAPRRYQYDNFTDEAWCVQCKTKTYGKAP